jgi:hypothetical protein
VHAVGLTWPLIVQCTPLGGPAAWIADIGLTLVCIACGHGFHRVFDRLRPVQPDLRRPA